MQPSGIALLWHAFPAFGEFAVNHAWRSQPFALFRSISANCSALVWISFSFIPSGRNNMAASAFLP
jgi:hypothetical protein